MGRPTEKMSYVLKQNGYTDEAIQQMSYEQASGLINQIKSQLPFNKVVAQKPVEFVERKPFNAKPTYNPSSQYVSYAKDVFLQLREMIHVEIMKPNSKMEVIADEVIMARAISLVKIAIKEFE